MKYPHIHHALYHRPWLIVPSFHSAMCRVLESRYADAPLDPIQPDNPEDTPDGIPVDGSSPFAQAYLDKSGIATVQVYGIITSGLSSLEKACCGGVSPEDLTKSLKAAVSDSRVRGIILDINSPGGTVAGVAEAANTIASVQSDGRVPLYVYTGDTLASAAYWLAAGASRIYATALATVGSVGVYVPVIDTTEHAAMNGIAVDIVKDGKYKADGYPGTKLSDDGRTMLQDEVNKIGAMFRSHVSAHRSRVSADTMQGQTFLGIDAADVGLVDGIVTGVEDVKRRLN